MTVAVVLEEDVATTDRRHEQILIAVVVDVGERSGDPDAIGEPDAGFGGDVAKSSATKVLPELVAAELVDEIDVFESIAIHVCHGNAGAVIVVDQLVESRGV